MTCTRCGSCDIHRSRRSGACDQIQSWVGRYPYRCGACGLRFCATGPYLDTHPAANSTYTAGAQQQHRAPNPAAAASGPEMAFRTDMTKPQAKIVVQAETHEQLNHILLTLDAAINAYGKTTRPENTRASYA